MASIYDIAKIQSGDPLGVAKRQATEASTIFEQYKHQKDIIEEINKAIADAKKKSKKNRGLFSGAGSLLGGLASAFIPGGALVSALLSGAGAGIGAGIGEKYRQDKYDPTKELRKVKSKLKGRKQFEDVASTTDLFEDNLKGGLTSDVITSAILGGLMPMEFTKGVQGVQGVPMNISSGASALPGVETIKSGFKIGGEGSILDAILPEKLASKLPAEWLEGASPEWLEWLIRTMGTPSMSSSSPQVVSDPYAQPEFRNPFRGGY